MLPVGCSFRHPICSLQQTKSCLYQVADLILMILMPSDVAACCHDELQPPPAERTNNGHSRPQGNGRAYHFQNPAIVLCIRQQLFRSADVKILQATRAALASTADVGTVQTRFAYLA